MTIHSVLRHRATIRRAQKLTLNGEPLNSWAVVAADVRCLLDLSGQQTEPTYDSDRASTFRDPSGVLMTAPDVDLKPGDRVEMTRGPGSHYVVRPGRVIASNLMGAHHFSYAVDGVS